MATIPPEFQTIYDAGAVLQGAILNHLKTWREEINSGLIHQRLSEVIHTSQQVPREFVEQNQMLHERVHAWFNLLARDILPHTTYNRDHINLLLRRVISAIDGTTLDQDGQPRKAVYIPIAIYELNDAMDQALRLIRTASPPGVAGRLGNHLPTASHAPNTAFILMSMNPNDPLLVDVHETVKRVFAQFDITAVRADEFEHQDSITQLVLDQIKRAEFLFADLSGERPNVYYEVGYAHAPGKRPILYRRTGTPLHFDLAVHNVPEYQNMTSLEDMLKRRLTNITGREPNQ